MSAPGISATYTYDTETGRTVGQTVTTAGAKTTYIVDANDRLASMSDSAGKTTYVFDALGRRTSQTLSGTTTTYTWDDASRLTSWTRGADSAIYTYDAAGQRTRTVHTQGGTTPVVTTTDYTYDGITLLALSAQQSTTATWTVTYLYDEDGRPYAGVYTSGTAPVTFLIATNDRGDVVGLTNTAGTWFARYTYDPYGRVLAQSAQAVSGITSTLASQIATRQVLRYASYAYDAHSATYYLSARHYDPATARFLTKDPARDDGEESAYQYCAGDPVGKVDPTGMWAWIAYHYVTKNEANRNNWTVTVSSVLGWGAQEFVTALVAAPWKVLAVPKWMRDAWKAASHAGSARDAYNAIKSFQKAGDLVILQRDTYARYSASCHSPLWWTVAFRFQVQRKEQGRWVAKRTWNIQSLRCQLVDSKTGKAPVGTAPRYIGWPKRVHSW